MRNQYSKYKNPDGSTKRKPKEVLQMTSGITGRLWGLSLFGHTGRGRKFRKPVNKAEKIRRRKQRRLNLKKN